MDRQTIDSLNDSDILAAYRRGGKATKPRGGLNKPGDYRGNRYHVDGMTLDSKPEYQRYLELKELQAAGRIRGLKRAKRMTLLTKQKTADGVTLRGVTYTADFEYQDAAGRKVIEEVKSKRTYQKPDFKLRFKMAQWLYPEYAWRLVVDGKVLGDAH